MKGSTEWGTKVRFLPRTVASPKSIYLLIHPLPPSSTYLFIHMLFQCFGANGRTDVSEIAGVPGFPPLDH